MAEAAGLALGIVGAVGVLGQLLDGCLKGYRIFTVASNLGRDSERLVYKVRIEEMRLMIWGSEWGVPEGHFEQRLSGSRSQEGLKSLAEMILKELYRTIMDLNALQDRYGLREETPGSVDRDAYLKNSDPNNITSAKGGTGIKLRARWVVNDRERFGNFLNDLQFYNDKLENLFPPARVATLQRALTNGMLQNVQRDLTKLDILEHASRPSYPNLSTLAELKQLKINLDAKDTPKKRIANSELKIQHWRLQLLGDDVGSMIRCCGTYHRPTDALKDSKVSEEVDIFVEWIPCDAKMGFEERCSVYQKVDNLARMLHSSSNRHPDLHTLDCIGHVEDAQRSRYGMVFLVPPKVKKSASIASLASLIKDCPIPDLECRFQLAYTIAIALWSCHSLDWLHKTLCPQNILFFDLSDSDETGLSPLSKPYLAGFDSSRPDDFEEISVASRNLVGEDIYRHPFSLGPDRQKYCKAFDIYSLGLLLLEIGLWKGLDIIHKGRSSKYTPKAFKDKIIQSLVPALGAKTGSRYRNVVHQCLVHNDCSQDSQAAQSHQLMQRIVEILEGLQV